MINNNNDSNWLYILLTIIALGISLVKAIAKKFKDPGDQPELSPWEEDIPEERSSPSIYGNIGEPVEYQPKDIYVKQPEKFVVPEEEAEEAPVAEPLFADQMEEEVEESGFDLRKAVIYSEILHRKYN